MFNQFLQNYSRTNHYLSMIADEKLAKSLQKSVQVEVVLVYSDVNPFFFWGRMMHIFFVQQKKSAYIILPFSAMGLCLLWSSSSGRPNCTPKLKKIEFGWHHAYHQCKPITNNAFLTPSHNVCQKHIGFTNDLNEEIRSER